MSKPRPQPKVPKRKHPIPADRRQQDFLEGWRRLNPDPPRLPDELVREPDGRK